MGHPVSLRRDQKRRLVPCRPQPRQIARVERLQDFHTIAMILRYGLCNFFIIIILACHDIYRQCKKKDDVAVIPVTAPGEGAEHAASAAAVSYDEEKRNAAFLKEQIPLWIPHTGYIILALVSTLAVPTIFPQVKFYHVVITYVVAPVLAFCNSYGCGLTDWSLASSYGNLPIFGFAAWTGVSSGRSVAGLAVCGVMMNIVGSASDLMQDLKTGFLTLASPRTMFISQVVGTAMGCLVAPCVFWIFYKAIQD